jgi:hypothetical protein
MLLAAPLVVGSQSLAQPPWSPYGQNPQPPFPQSPVTPINPATPTPVPSAAPTANANRMVSRWYHHYLHRRPDATGLSNCVYQLQTGQTPTAVKGGLLGSDEYFQLHGSTPQGFVQGLYQDVLGKGPSQRGMGYWLNKLNADGGNRQQMAVDFLNWVAQYR